MKTKPCGFTLIEVLLALSIIAIAITALFKATALNVKNTQRLKEKSISHWVALQGITMIQLGLVASNQNTQVTSMLGEQWYWHAEITATPIKTMQKITITVSKKQSGPFRDPTIGFRITR